MRALLAIFTLSIAFNAFGASARKPSLQRKPNEYNVSAQDFIKPVGIIKGLTDEQLLETVQRQTFRFFWHYAHPISALARERSDTVRADFYWDYINEAQGEPNLSKGTFGPEACAIGGT